MDNKITVHGEFRLDVRGPDGVVRELLPWQDNLITNSGMDTFGTTTPFGGYLRVGTGTTPPAVTDTALANQVASTSTSLVLANTYPVAVGVYTANFPVGAAAGVLTELALSGSASGNISTHAQFVDAGGAPTSVTVLPDEQLIVTYNVRMAYNTADVVTTVTDPVTGVVYTVTTRPRDMWSGGAGSQEAQGSGLANTRLEMFRANQLAAYYGPASELGPANGSQTGGTLASMAPITVSNAAYAPGSYAAQQTVTVPVTSLNFADMSSFLSGVSNPGYTFPMRYKFGVSPKISKTSSQSLTLTFNYSWARA